MESFTNYSSYRVEIIIADEITMWTRGRGTVRIEWLLANDTSYIININNVLYIPTLIYGIFLIHLVTTKGYNVIFSNDDYTIIKGNKIIGVALK